MSENSSIISISTEIMGGTPVFLGTRVPIQTLFDYLEAGESIVRMFFYVILNQISC